MRPMARGAIVWPRRYVTIDLDQALLGSIRLGIALGELLLALPFWNPKWNPVMVVGAKLLLAAVSWEGFLIAARRVQSSVVHHEEGEVTFEGAEP